MVKGKASGLGVASLILGIIGIVLMFMIWFPFVSIIGFILAILAIIFGAIAFWGSNKDKFGLAGFILGIIGISLIVVVSALTYVYVSSMIGPMPSSSENAAVIVTTDNNLVRIVLVKGGDNYNIGYTSDEVRIYVGGDLIQSPVIWQVGEEILVGKIGDTWTTDATSAPEGEVTVTVTIMDTVIYDGLIDI